MNRCPDTRVLEDYAGSAQQASVRESSPPVAPNNEPATEIRDHLVECESCRSRFEEIRQNLSAQEWVRRIHRETPPGPAAGDVDRGVGGAPRDDPHLVDFGSYRILSEIGRGGMGTVYLAIDTRLDRKVALKVLRTSGKEETARFESEARMLASMHHPSIATALSLEWSGTRPVLVTEFVEGKTLARHLEDGALTVRETLRVGREVTSALDAAHSAGLIHRDLKPSNIMVTRDGRCKVLDFGLALRSPTSADTTTQGTRFSGTLGYMSPEQMRGAPPSPSADIWALGCVLYECLNGASPFSGMETNEVLALSLSGRSPELTFPRDVPEPLGQLVRSCLEVRAERRPSNSSRIHSILAGIAVLSTAAQGYHDPDQHSTPTSQNAPSRTNLPDYPTSFLGRTDLVADLLRAVRSERIVTLCGTVGVGKTRLGVEAAGLLVSHFRDGVWVVDLSIHRTEREIASALRDAINLPPVRLPETGEDRPSWEQLAERAVLLLLDNCDASLESGRVVVQRLLEAGLEAHVLATSREPLRVPGERLLRITPLTCLPDESGAQPAKLRGSEAESFLLDRLRSADPGFQLTSERADLIVRICRRLDGLPLALEMCASKIQVLSLEQIEERLGERFRLLTPDRSEGPIQEASVRDMVEWSVNRLSPEERTLFLRLSIFDGGWTVEAAESVCTGGLVEKWDIVDLLISLLDRSLIEKQPLPAASPCGPRFRMLHTLRDHARAELGKNGTRAVAARHEEHFVEWISGRPERPSPTAEASWLDHVAVEHANTRQALAHCLMQGHTVPASELVLGLFRFWEVRGHWEEALHYSDAVLSEFTLQPERRVRLLMGAGGIAASLGRTKRARRQLEEARDLARGIEAPELMARVSHRLGSLAFEMSDFRAAQARYCEALSHTRRSEDRWAEAALLNNLGAIAVERRCFRRAQVLQERSLQIRRSIGDRRGVAMSLGNLGNVRFHAGDLDEAENHYLEALASHEDMGHSRNAATQIYSLGRVATARGRLDLAREHYLESLERRRRLGDRVTTAASLIGLAEVAVLDGDWASARGHYSEALGIYHELGNRLWVGRTLTPLGVVLAHLNLFELAARVFGVGDAERSALRDPPPPEIAASRDEAVLIGTRALGAARWGNQIEAGRRLGVEGVLGQLMASGS